MEIKRITFDGKIIPVLSQASDGLKVVAGGGETFMDWEALKEHGCKAVDNFGVEVAVDWGS